MKKLSLFFIVLLVVIGFTIPKMGSAPTSTTPAYPALDISASYELVKGSDNYQEYKDVFARSARTLVSNGACDVSDFQNLGGWLKSINYRDKPVYFTYCRGMTLANRIYLDVSTESTFR